MISQKVESSNIAEVGYEDNTLYVTFIKSGTYAYVGVPFLVYQQMVAAESVGKFFHAQIKPNFAHKKLEPA